MMNIEINTIADREVYPIIIKTQGNSLITLYYYTCGYSYRYKRDSGVLHDMENLIYFKSYTQLERFCQENNLIINGDIVVFDFDIQITEIIDYKTVLENWNMLNTISSSFGMHFEGDEDRYTSLYQYLFCCNTSIEPLPPTIRICEKYYKQLTKVFKKNTDIYAGSRAIMKSTAFR